MECTRSRPDASTACLGFAFSYPYRQKPLSNKLLFTICQMSI